MVPPDALGQEPDRGAVLVGQADPRGARRGEVQGDAGHPRPGGGQGVEHRDGARGAGRPAAPGAGQAGQVARRRAAGLVAALQRLPPAGQQVQVDLVALGAGDRVMVRAEDQLPPGLVQPRGRVPGAGQPGQRGQPLAVLDRDLRGPLQLLGVHVGHVLAGIHRVHVPGLRGDPHAAPPGVPAHRGEELARHRGDEPRPDVPGVPVPVDPGRPAGRDHVVGAHRQQHVAGRRHRREQRELLVGGPLRGGQIRGVLGDPAGPVVIGHVGGQQPAAVRRDPLELAGELHPGVAADAAVRPPLVERAPGPRGLGQPGRGHQPRVARVEPERVQHPGRPRAGAEHVALEAEAVDRVADGGLGGGQVGVRLVVAAAGDLHPAAGDELQQIRAVLRVRVEMRLQVVDLGQHELVVRILPGLVQVQPDQLERGPGVRQPAGLVRQQQPGLGELALGVPPDRVVVEVADHPHGPAGLRDRDLAGQLGPAAGRPGLGGRGDAQRGARAVRRGHLHRDLGGRGAARRRRRDLHRARGADPGPVDTHGDHLAAAGGRAAAIAGQGHPDQLQRVPDCPAKQVG